MKRSILLAGFLLAFLVFNAQIKVYSGGKAAFGSTSTTPNYNIDVITGDINVNTATNGYRIAQKFVLRQNLNSTIFVGTEAGNSNTAKHNSALGYRALYTNSTGTPNNAFGYKALYSCSTGYLNDAFGDSALYATTTGVGNTGMGPWALTQNTYGNNNVALGGKAMQLNTTGNANTAVGYAALNKNTGGQNTGVGYQALLNTTSGSNNTAVGHSAGSNVTTSSYNTMLGYGANISTSSTYSNSTALGYTTTATASNYIAIGNTSIQTIAGQVSFSTYSDQRVKNNIQENVRGLDFILKLRPVTYKYDVNKEHELMGISSVDSTGATVTHEIEKTTFSGFLAQEVEQAAQSVNYDFSGVDKPRNANMLYGLRYSEFVVPIVKAMQEQQGTIEKQDSTIHKQDSLIKDLQRQVNQVVNNCCSSTGQRTNQNTVDDKKNLIPGDTGIEPKLWQNTPNPFNQTTIIKCFVPDLSKNASLLVFDLTGALKKTISINGTGEINLTINAKELIAGMYHYSLIVDGQEIDTKKMILTE